MRTFLLTVFWITNIGNVIQLLVIVSASWMIFSGRYSFFELDGNAFLTQVVPGLLWLKTLIILLLGDLGRLVLAIPILIIAPLKLIFGTAIGIWAYSTAMGVPINLHMFETKSITTD
jgi:membrane-associated phospholipid phosphatase